MMEDDYVNENARARWMERQAALAPSPVVVKRDEDDDDEEEEDEDDDFVSSPRAR